jgi:hypothetical protein
MVSLRSMVALLGAERLLPAVRPIGEVLHNLPVQKMVPDDAVDAGFIDAAVIDALRPDLQDRRERARAKAACPGRDYAVANGSQR